MRTSPNNLCGVVQVWSITLFNSVEIEVGRQIGELGGGAFFGIS